MLKNTELYWIKTLKTPYPLGLNDNIYGVGNISKLSFNIFHIFPYKRRKRRSRGKRVNRNIRKRRKCSCTLRELHALYLQSRHALLTKLSSLPVSSLLRIKQDASSIVLRSNPLYEVSSIVEQFINHRITPHIDNKEEHRRYFIKLQYVNKGLDFINLSSILRDKNVTKCIPSYFINTEVPVISYTYKKSVRNLLLNYNSVVSDPDISSNTPTT